MGYIWPNSVGNEPSPIEDGWILEGTQTNLQIEDLSETDRQVDNRLQSDPLTEQDSNVPYELEALSDAQIPEGRENEDSDQLKVPTEEFSQQEVPTGDALKYDLPIGDPFETEDAFQEKATANVFQYQDALGPEDSALCELFASSRLANEVELVKAILDQSPEKPSLQMMTASIQQVLQAPSLSEDQKIALESIFSQELDNIKMYKEMTNLDERTSDILDKTFASKLIFPYEIAVENSLQNLSEFGNTMVLAELGNISEQYRCYFKMLLTDPIDETALENAELKFAFPKAALKLPMRKYIAMEDKAKNVVDFVSLEAIFEEIAEGCESCSYENRVFTCPYAKVDFTTSKVARISITKQ